MVSPPPGRSGEQRRSRTCSLPPCCGSASSCASCPYRRAVLPRYALSFRHWSALQDPPRGGLEPHYAAGRVLDHTLRESVISPSPTPTPSGRGMCAVPRGRSVPAVMRNCLPHCHRVLSLRGTPPYNRPGTLACWLFHPSTRCQIRGFIPGRIIPGGHGSGIPPAAAPSFRGASMGRKESIRETGIEPAFS